MMKNPTKPLSPRERRRRRTRRIRVISVIALLGLIAAWIYGYTASASDVKPLLPDVLPGAEHFQQSGQLFVGYTPDDNIVGYAATSQAMGYGGPVQMLVGVDPAGAVIGVQVIEHKETPGFFRLLPRNRFFDQFLGMDYSNPYRLGEDIDVASGATLSSEAVAASIHAAVREIATSELDKDVAPRSKPVQFGVPEFSLIALYAVGYFAHQMKNKNLQKKIRWLSLLAGAIILGFIFNKPLTMANITSLVAGFWPSWRTNLYWYLLLGGIFFVTTTQSKNPYCHWFCPFGSVQEILGALTDAKPFRPRQYHTLLLWFQRGLAYLALLLGLALRMPGAASPEPFGALFNLTGTWPQFALLVIVLLTSLIVYRPFCNYLCPLEPVDDFISEGRKWILELWRNLRNQLLEK